MRSAAFLLFLVLLSKQCFSQQIIPTKQRVLKAFKESTKLDRQDTWLTCNEDSAFYKAKIVKLYNHINYLYDPQHCCNHIGWKFSSAEDFLLQQKLICQEPPLGIILQNAVCHVDVRSEKKKVVVIISNGIQKTRFKAISLATVELWNKKDESLVLTLERE